MLVLAYVLIGAVVVERLVELCYARRNARALIARGALEVGRGHYTLIVFLHAAWIVAVAVFLPRPPAIHWAFLVLMLALQALRVWVIVSLGPYWTTRIVTLKDTPLIRRGPYRYVRHPNYLVVVGEIADFPLAFGEVGVAIVFSVLNAALLAWRVRTEERALRPRRGLP